MFRRIKVLKSLINARHKSVKIVQVEPEMFSKADRIKKLNFENKYMYGAKSKKKDKSPEVISEETKSNNDISSEIYWTCLHVAEVQDFSKPRRKAKKDVVDDQSELDELKASLKKEDKKPAKKKPPPQTPIKLDEELEPEDSPKKAVKKKASKKIVIVPELPYTLTQLSSALPPTKNEKPSARDKLQSSKDSSATAADENFVEREIPFEKQQLRAITSFPMTLENKKIVSPLETLAQAKTSIYLPSVSKVLQNTMPESQRKALIQWKNLKISELGLEGFNLMQQSHLSRGKQFHQCLQNHFRGETIVKTDLPLEVVEIWKSIEPLLHRFDAPGVLIEEKVKHPYLLYQGIVDCVSFHDSTLSVIEWKKSDRQKKSLNFTFDAPVQLCSYLGALNASKEEFRENPIKSGVVVVAYNDGQEADLFELNESDLKKYWKLWLHRLQEYWVRYRDDTLPEEI